MKTQTYKLAGKVLRQMSQKGTGHATGGGIMLTGDPGVGKTTFVEILSALIGISAVVIEVPHITEEHLINIPFLVIDKDGHQSSHHTAAQVPENASPKYNIILADSSLYSHIVKVTTMNDQQYLQHIQKAPKVVQELYMAFGGNATAIPPIIQQVRQHTRSILFLDEFYRQTSTRIRNILRSILNGYIGKDKIPTNSYIMYASNMRDSGLEDVPSNHEFTEIEYKTPSKDEWFTWFAGKFEQDMHVQLNKVILDKFKKVLSDDDISYNDLATEVRTSPRRWEQILLYINSSLPVQSREEARSLLTNVKNNFINYETKEHSDLSKKVLKVVQELIKDTSSQDVSENDTLDDHEWRSALLHAVEQARKLGERRKHVPIISGPPGIGKTTEALAVANKFNMRLISIDAGELNAEDTTGMATPHNQTKDSMEVKFSLPKLHQQILTNIKTEDAAYIKQLREQYGDKAQEKIEAYKNQQWKYLIFFDEINRVDEKTFNSLRRVILEKNFGPDGEGGVLKLPEGSIVVGAMNPEGVGTSPLTQHFKDVIDVIPAGASWEKTKKYLAAKDFKGVPNEIKEASLQLIEAFVKKFQSKDDTHSEHVKAFSLDFNGQVIPISPREYTTMLELFVRELVPGIDEVLNDEDIDGDEVRDHVDELVGDCFQDSLNFVFSKAQVPREEIMSTLRKWVTTIDGRIFGALLTKKVENINSLAGVLTKYLTGEKPVTEMTQDVELVNNNNAMNNSQVIEEIKQLFNAVFVDQSTVDKLIIDENQPKVEVSDVELKLGSAKVSQTENFVLSLLFTLHLHQYANDRLTVIGKATSMSISDVLAKLVKAGKIDEDTKQDAAAAVASIRGDVHELIAEL